MEFQRGVDVKESIGIGLEKDSVSVKDIRGRLIIRWRENTTALRLEIVFRKRKYISLSKILPLLNEDQIPLSKLRLYFKAYKGYRMYEELNKDGSFGLWRKARQALKKNQKNTQYAQLELTNSGSYEVIGHESDNERPKMTFGIQTEDVEKIQKNVKRDITNIKGLKYNGKIYPVKLGTKEII